MNDIIFVLIEMQINATTYFHYRKCFSFQKELRSDVDESFL